MKIELHEIFVKDIVNGYKDNQEDGVVGYGGKLDIRPPYQREFVYKDEQRDAVITSILDEFPLNVMYWAVREDGTYEVLDGQQRTISICGYASGHFSANIDGFLKGMNNLPQDKQEQILNYKLMIYFCEGTDSEKLAWFEIVNIAGAVLTKQELRNAVYHGSWVTDAKRYFSRSNGAAYLLGKNYVSGVVIRQEYLETAIEWINGGKIEEYMSIHQHNKNADELWLYFQAVIQWVQTTFPKYRKEMKGLNWGKLYNDYKSKRFDTNALETTITKLMIDDDVSNKKGIYEYVLTGEERCLNIRAFSDSMKRGAYERQGGICPKCKKHFDIEQMEGDHITPWHEGGKTITENCQMLCKDCNRRKSGK
ncbi:hypothetical protein FACS189454_01410 [Planctomycetales bacterium]|nr:hypothetical protein FACS189454_01410 [Planctomycetales bacterium]